MFTYQCTKDKDNADNNKEFDRSETVSLWNVAGDAVENVDKDKEDCDKNCHPSWNTFWRNEETDPGDDDEHPSREVVGYDVVGHFSAKCKLKSSDRKVA